MSEQKVKVSDLPEAEQKELLAEAAALKIRGVAMTAWTVEALKKKIAEARQTMPETPAPAAARQTTGAEQATETKTAETLDTVEQNITDSEENISQGDKKQQKQPKKDGDEFISSGENEQQSSSRSRNGICHICRSRVIDGKCTGCGFEVKRQWL